MPRLVTLPDGTVTTVGGPDGTISAREYNDILGGVGGAPPAPPTPATTPAPRDPFEQFFEMLFGGGGFGGGHQAAHAPAVPHGPSAEDNRITQGLNDRDDAYLNYLNAAGAATDFINSQIDTERSDAALMGVNFEMTDEIKSGRINDYFSTIWGEGDQTRLEGLFEEFGEPDDFVPFIVTRGTAAAEGEGGDEEPVADDAAAKGRKPGRFSIATVDDDDVLGGSTSLLGA